MVKLEAPDAVPHHAIPVVRGIKNGSDCSGVVENRYRTLGRLFPFGPILWIWIDAVYETQIRCPLLTADCSSLWVVSKP